MTRRRQIVINLFIMVATLALFAGAHALVDHFGQTASSGSGTYGSKWIHTDTSGTRYGLWGESSSSAGRGIYGLATANSGSAHGVFGKSESSSGQGVYAYNSSTSGATYGVLGESNSTSSTASGVYGYNGRTSGDTRGVQGLSSSTNGVGVYGVNVGGTSSDGVGVYGYNNPDSGTGIGVIGFNESSSGWAGSFNSNGHGVTISTPGGKTALVVTGGSKSAAVPTNDGDRLLYNEESTEVWFSDYGFGRLDAGQAVVTLDPIYVETVDTDVGYHVFLQANGDASIYVSQTTPTTFEVRAQADSVDLNAGFSYRVVAKRLGFENQRLEFAPWVSP